jgi:chromate reductase, NAD(P)H dehydrogenase (quinone)
MSDIVQILGICGSLRQASYNRGLLRAAVELAPADARIETADISAIPLYDEDVREKGFPAAVETLRRQVSAADALLIVTPEYNYSMPGVLKNAIDWVSRPPDQPFDGKPMAMMGASMGNGGTMRAQYHLRQTAVFLNMHLLNKPEIFVARAQDKFDAEGKLTDESTRKYVGRLVADLATWVRRLRK